MHLTGLVSLLSVFAGRLLVWLSWVFDLVFSSDGIWSVFPTLFVEVDMRVVLRNPLLQRGLQGNLSPFACSCSMRLLL